jgi:uncharacterized protein
VSCSRAHPARPEPLFSLCPLLSLVDAVAALGRRSLSGYLFQSVAWLVLTAPFLLDLPSHAPSPTFAAAGSAIAVWALTVVGAAALERRGNRGPAENLLRRLTYVPR